MELTELLQNITVLSVLIFCAGVVLLIVEMFHPGFGVAGILGLACLVADIFIVSRTLAQGMVMTGIVAAVVLILLVIAATLVSRGKLPKTLTLKESTDKKSGFIGGEDLGRYLGKEGTAVTDLRPAGTAEIGGERVDVVSRGEFIEAGTTLLVIETGGNRVVVKAAGRE